MMWSLHFSKLSLEGALRDMEFQSIAYLVEGLGLFGDVEAGLSKYIHISQVS